MPASSSPSRLYLLLIILLFIILTPTGSPPRLTTNPETTAALASLSRRITLLHNSTASTPPPEYRLVSPPNATLSLPPVLSLLSKLWRNTIPASLIARHSNSHPTVYRNATANVHGEWLRPALNEAEEILFQGSNETGDLAKHIIKDDDGTMTVGIEETGNGEVEMVVRVKDADGGQETVLAGFKGYHDYATGEMLAVTHSEDVLPWLWFKEDKERWNRTRETAVGWLEAKRKRVEEYGSSYGDDAGNTAKRCDYALWVQLHPIDLSKEELKTVERELRNPTGVKLPPIPDVELAIMLWSPTCGGVITARELKGDKVEVFYSRVSMVGLGAAIVTVVQMGLLIRQMEKSSTPSTISRVSFWTVVMLAIQDGYWFLVFLVVAIYLEGCFLPLATASFFYLILLTMFEMRFLVNTYKVQRPETSATAPPTTLPTVNTAPAPLGLPAPAIAPTPAARPPPDIRTELSALHTRFYFFLVVILFVTLHATSWTPFYRDLFLHFLFLVTNSFWVPQIARNIYRGSRRPFAPEFIVGTSICRLAPAAYLYLYQHNVFGVVTHKRSVLVLAGWQAIQCVVLGVQSVLGSRFAIPRALEEKLPSVWDYHNPPYFHDNRGDDVSRVGLLSEPDDRDAEEGFANNTTERDCAVCMQPVEAVTMDAGLMERRKVMWTPCRHGFHTECLEGWLRYRLQCPVCRNALPPL